MRAFTIRYVVRAIITRLKKPQNKKNIILCRNYVVALVLRQHGCMSILEAHGKLAEKGEQISKAEVPGSILTGGNICCVFWDFT